MTRISQVRALRFAAVGAIGTVLNVALMAGLLKFDMNYLVASLVATEVTILTNFAAQERFVFKDRIAMGPALSARLVRAVGFNNVEWMLRAPVLAVLVTRLGMDEVLAQALTLAAAFGARFVFNTLLVYRPASGPTTELEHLRVSAVTS